MIGGIEPGLLFIGYLGEQGSGIYCPVVKLRLGSTTHVGTQFNYSAVLFYDGFQFVYVVDLALSFKRGVEKESFTVGRYFTGSEF